MRPVKHIIESKPAIEGAGVKLRRAFGFGDTGEFDPFLLLDDFRNDRPQDYRAGFPWPPPRGIETIRTPVTTSESDLARAPCGDLTRVGGIPGMALRQYAGRHDRHASDSAKMAVRRLEAR